MHEKVIHILSYLLSELYQFLFQQLTMLIRYLVVVVFSL